ncbi:TPA: hypothetical protein ACGD7Y_003552, partial [Serratia marcescens]
MISDIKPIGTLRRHVLGAVILDGAADLHVTDGMPAYSAEVVNALIAENAALKDTLGYICNRGNEPEYHDCGMGCGLEDRGITDRYEAMYHGWESAMGRVYSEVIPDAMPETPITDAALAAIEARFCGLLGTYGKEEPERFNPEFADLYAKIVNRIFSSVMDNPSVTDLESLTDYLESNAENSRAYADMSMKFHA